MEIAEGRDWLTGGAFGLEGGLIATILILVGFLLQNCIPNGNITNRQEAFKASCLFHARCIHHAYS